MLRLSLTSIFIFSVGVALIFVFVLPAWNNIDNLITAKEEKQKELVELESIVAHIDELSEQYKKAQDDLEKISLVIPSNPQLPEILIQLEEMVKRNGIIIGDIKFSQEQESLKGEKSASNGIKVVKINIEAEGNYLNLKKLLEDIEVNIRLMNADSISFSRSGANQDTIKFTIGITSYYLATGN
ncbi:MAG: hypothetical protein US71_C0017G0006 [Parcubacteria group bacterium GW2011_GWD2_38_12]|uniref:Pilus assembly protein PilO n=1 Tax=Candidatus Azambacteria bacterium RIFCSPLOWO2_01_FULL_37_9 TaxID=1797297 RepID=A0A1F5C7N5_9BACT|nr:MAG: hypothetical protein US06_C0004G0011 [Parcubacteria group bacterium GW2011_GWC2_36_17]KKQ39004.1 MAG: hypothetical protein US56_C0029G0004 [Candidatus Moranbacteria bacterium GW2011_GWF2_37_7]KKQ43144.1 MAG: hypothetical protein US61_C0015G0009 [Parcubacteria group bacterium GW2011_GWE2_37_8]KKQ51115.1 MAG: hypothetical protein US71_C0017G0006 [Parcubacteria group bacterium GW2011_GWD2_38_12]KKQ57979.1 MAG: hypothetical protein US78_C0027G0005 [Parcubacteria group bacterium GW2011_GWD1_